MELLQAWNKAKVQKFRQSLLRWYGKSRRALPWRNNPTPYRIWISEVMLQQTQVKTVIPYYNRFLSRFPDIKSLAEAGEDEVLALWAGLGYYGRARNLHKASRLILERHAKFPEQHKDILALPGIGQYTAGAICSLAFNQPRPVVDGNIERVITRLKGITKRPPKSHFWRQMSDWIPKTKSSSFNQAMMELGAVICVSVEPRCPRCPVQSYCVARRRGLQNQIPAVSGRHLIKRIRLAILVLEHDGRFLLTSTQKPAYIPGKWGFPCREVLESRSPVDAASAMCREMLGRRIDLEPAPKASHSITRYRITGHGFFGKLNRPGRALQGTSEFRWVQAGRLKDLLTSSLFKKVVQKFPGWDARFT